MAAKELFKLKIGKMTGNLANRFYCDFCKIQALGLQYKDLPSSKLVICQQCIKSMTIGSFLTRLRAYPENIQNLTLKEITDDNRMDYTAAD